MEEDIQIIPVDSVTFELQSYSTEDTNVISTLEVDTEFSQSSDYIEYYIYDENQNLIYPSSTEQLFTFTVKEGNVLLSPDQDLSRLGFDNGSYYITYDFYRQRLASSISENYFISEISSDRTEIKLISNTISGSDVLDSTAEFIQF